MCRIIAAVVLFLLMVGLCISDRIVIDNAYEDLYEKTLRCEEAVDTPESKDSSEQLEKEFEQTEGLLSVFVNHDILDEIAESVARLKILSGVSRADYLSECASIKLKLEYIKKDSGVNLHSIF